jgi:hypothetical protein
MSAVLTRRSTLIGMAGALGGLSLGASASGLNWGAEKKLAARNLDAQLALQIHVKLGETEDMGKGADGHRINYPIVGGHFVGKGLKGEVVSGGADMSIMRNDGVTMIEALYRLKTDDNQTIIIHNPGIWRPNDVGLKKMQAGEALLEEDYYCLTTPSFKTPPGKYNWLTQNIFVGTIDDLDDYGVLIGCYLMNTSA